MRFWDSSALVPFLLAEPTSPHVRALAATDAAVTVWWGTEVECAGAIARAEVVRRVVPGAARAAAYRALADLARSWQVVAPSTEVKTTAMRLLRVHPLRAADALQLAAALVACGHRPSELEFVTLDERLAQAAEGEGFRLV